MTKLNFLMAIVTLLFVSSCSFRDDDGGIFNCIKGEGATVTEELNIGDFTGVKINCAADVFITQGDEIKVTAEGQQNIIDLIETDIQDDTWDVEFDQCVRNHDGLKLFITMPNIYYLSIDGSGNITGENVFEVGGISLRISGSGEMDLAIEAIEKVDTRIAGSGEMRLEGFADELEVEISGSGDMEAFDLTTQEVDVNISGSGDVEVYAEEYLDVKITGSGDVHYKGAPLIDVDITGSGDIINGN